jgi:hypothetical protein
MGIQLVALSLGVGHGGAGSGGSGVDPVVLENQGKHPK